MRIALIVLSVAGLCLQPPDALRPDSRDAGINLNGPPPNRPERSAPQLVFGLEGANALIRRGAAAFDEIDEALDDPELTGAQVGAMFGALSAIPGDRSRFLDVTIVGLSDKRFGARGGALKLLAQIGSEKDTAPVVALLLDAGGESFEAAKTLAAIGGKQDLIAFDLILRDVDRYKWKDGRPLINPHYAKHYTECRNQLEKRLKDAETKAKLADKK